MSRIASAIAEMTQEFLFENFEILSELTEHAEELAEIAYHFLSH